MANAVRKICTKIGNGHQYLLGTAKPSALGGQLVLDTVQRQPPVSQVERKCKPSSVFGRSRQLFAVDEPAVVKQRMTAAVEWFNGHGRRTVKERSVFPLTNLNSTMTKPDISNKSDTSCSNNVPKSEGLPSAEQLENMFNKLGEDLPLLFRQTLDFTLYHPGLIFENNIRGTKSVGLQHFMTTVSMLRLIGHIKYAYVKFDILKITKHPEDGTIKIRWRIKGISGFKVFMKFWKFRLWGLEEVIKENSENWYDGFSIFYVGSDGKVHKLTADKMMPDNDPVIEDKSPLATKLALCLGLSPQLDNLDCLMALDLEQTNELLKMIILSLEEVVKY